jgi:LacI family transcriptional regulator
MNGAGLDIRDEWMLGGAFNKGAGFAIGTALFALPTLPTAIFVANDQQAIGVVRAASDAGLRIPEDVAIVTFDGTEDAAYCVPPLTTIRQPIEEIAKTAVALLLTPEAFDSNRVTCPFDLLIRRSCGCPVPAP